MTVATLFGRILIALVAGLAVGVVLWLIALLVGRAFRRTGEPAPHGRRLVAFGLAAVVGAFVAVLVTLRLLNLTGGGTPAPPPTITDPTMTDQRQAIVAYAGSLEFDSVTHGASDLQHLTLPAVNAQGDTVALPLGPLGAVYPEKNAHRNKLADLLKGRIVARIWVDRPGYQKLGLQPGVNWVWIDSLPATDTETRALLPVLADPETMRRATAAGLVPPGATRAESLAISELVGGAFAQALSQQPGRPQNFIRREGPPADTARAVIIPEDPSAPIAIRPLYIFRRAHPPFNTPLARWLFRADDDGLWINCASHGCCCTSMCVN